MPGMNSGLNPADPTLVAAFRSALFHQGAIALIAIVFLWLIWATARTWRVAPPTGKGGAAGAAGGAADAADATGQPAEARGRRLLRIGFGLLWIFDGILQAQPKMAGGLASQVIQPIAAASPAWVQHLVNWGGTAWSYHPIQAGAASVWIQVGIGAWLIVASRGSWSRLAGLASVGWGLAVWVFGESFGGIFAPGLSWLTGAPGAVLIYVVAGALIALPEGAWRGPRLGRLLLGGLGLFFLGMALLQAWPGRGFWQGTVAGQPGTLAGMVQSMSGTPQPHFLSSLVSGFGSFDASNGFAVNLVVVIALAAMGAIFLTGRPRLVRYASSVRDRVLPGRLAAGAGPRLPGRSRDRPEQHDPDDPAVFGRLPRPSTCAARGARWRKRRQVWLRQEWQRPAGRLGAVGRAGTMERLGAAGRAGGGGSCGQGRWVPRWRRLGRGRSRRSRRWR